MLHLKSFTFNPFQENTYLLYDDDKTAFIIDPGNSNASEDKELKQFILDKGLKLSRLLLTHGHVDHIMGNRFIFDNFKLLPEVHSADLVFLERMQETAKMYGVNSEQTPMPKAFIKEGDKFTLGKCTFDTLHVPGHSPGSICFYCKEQKILMAGDVLFDGSIGRTDLPLGDHETLIRAIQTKLLILDEDVKVFPGHGPSTTIGKEKATNPFLT
jgi:hydroxyacylglutathione hydrolase